MPKVKRSTLTTSRGKDLPVWLFDCPGCGCMHYADDRWSFNRDVDKPTFSPSIKVEHRRHEICHFFVRDGKIQFCNDSTHDLKGQTVELPEIEEGE